MDVKTERANEAASVGGDQFVDDIPSDDELLRLFPSTPQFPHRSMRVGYALYLWMTVAAGDGGIAPLESMTLNGYVPAEYWIDDARRHCRTTLTLFNCHGAIEEMPDAVTALDGLRSLVMVRNRRLAVLPESLSRLAPSLTHLNVAANALTALPEAVGDLTRLQSLVLGQRGWVGCGGPSKPGISALPASLANCRRLTLLDLSNQRFGSIPDEVYSLTNLTSLAMARTGLAGPLPEAVTVLGSLATLDLSSNAVTGVNPTVANLTALTVLDLSGNPIDRLPWSVSRMSALTFLGVDGAPLAGIAASAGDQTGEEEEEEERDGSGDNGGGYCYEASSDMDYVLAGAPMAVTAAGAMDATPTDAASRFARLAAPSNEPALVVEAHFGAVAAEASGWFAVMRLLANPLTVIAAADGGGRAAKRTRFR